MPERPEAERRFASLQVSIRDRVGERFNGFRLHRALRDRGHRSSMLVLHRHSGDADVHDFSPAGALLERGLLAAERVTGAQGMLSPLAHAFPMRREFREAEVVHWQLVYPHFVSIPSMARMAHLRPTVWTLHDPWALTGHCVHPLECPRWLTGCGQCPDLTRNFPVWFDTTAQVWRAKRAAYREAPLTLVVSSRWMRARVAASPLTAALPCHVIPFGLDLEGWAPLDRTACRAALGLAPGERAIAFRLPGGAKGRNTKGIPALLEALERMTPAGPTALIVFEDRGALEALRARYRVIELGWVVDERRVAEALTAADVFVMPSPAESFGFMALESMACGTPVITTAGTATEDLVEPPSAGLSVPVHDSGALAAAITALLADGPRRAAMGEVGRRRVAEHFTFAGYVEAHERLYRELAARNRAEAR